MRRFLTLAIATTLVGINGARLSAAANFTGPDAELCSAAEAARVQSALFWTGERLPGDWSSPCPILVRPAAGIGAGEASGGIGAGGATTFQFDRGEVSGWRMTVQGSREEILRDVLPHEVDHMVRVSLVRRPIPRWLDEGCATLFESAESHRQFRSRLPQYLDQPITREFLDARDYPAGGAALDRLYVVGFSLVEFLLERQGPGPLLDLQKDSRSPSISLLERYRLTPETLSAEWQTWARERLGCGTECREVHCFLHGLFSSPAPVVLNAALPPLTVYTSAWCVPCRRFDEDLRTDPQFRAALLARFRLFVVDVNRQMQLAASWRIQSVPTFVTPTGRVVGYEGKTWLLQQLGIPVSAAQPSTDPSRILPQATGPSSSPAATAGSTSPPAAVPSAPRGTPILDTAAKVAPFVLTTLQLLGIVGGSAATGGLGALGIGLALRLFQRWRARRSKSSSREPPLDLPAGTEGGSAAGRFPFPRALDEARELLRLRQSEGRVAVLDALRGMFLDDELERIERDDQSAASLIKRLREAIDARVDEVAPLTTKLNE